MTRTNMKKALRTLATTTMFALGFASLAFNLKQASAQVRPDIYPAIEAAPAEIKAALAEARHTHKRVILDFGGNWCGDCQVLNIYFHQSPNAELLAKYFILVDVNIGHIDANQEIAEKYGVPLKKGVPGLAIVDGNGNVIYSQKGGEFEDMRHLQASDLTAFLNKWKP
jgi:thioredoxin 1